MKLTRGLIATFATATAALSFAGSLTTDMKFVGVAAGLNEQVSLDGTTEWVAAKQQVFHFGNSSAGSPTKRYDNLSAKVFCVEFTQWTDTSNTNTYEVTDLKHTGGIQSVGNQDLKVAALGKLVNESVKGYGSPFETTNDDFAAAFQTMAWKLIYDYNGQASSLNLSDGRFQVHAGMTSQATTIFNDLKTRIQNAPDNEGSPTFGTNFYGLSNCSHQDYMGSVPEPGTIGALSIGVTAMLRRRRRNRI